MSVPTVHLPLNNLLSTGAAMLSQYQDFQLCGKERRKKPHKMYVIEMKSWRICYLLHFYLQHICVHMPFLGKDPWGKWCLRQQWLEVFSQAPATAVRWTPHPAASDSSGKTHKNTFSKQDTVRFRTYGHASKSLDKLMLNSFKKLVVLWWWFRENKYVTWTGRSFCSHAMMIVTDHQSKAKNKYLQI